MIFNEIYEEIKKSNSIAIFTHIRADGDCLGSGMALYYALKDMGKEVSVFNGEAISTHYYFVTKGLIKNSLDKDYDLFISVDSSSFNRLGIFENDFRNKENTICFDHHLSNNIKAKLSYVDSSASSNCEILYTFFNEMNIPLNKNIAEALMCGLSSDTGCFRHANTTSRTHLIASELMKFNFDIDTMYYYLFKIKSRAEVSLIEKSLKNIQYFYDGQLVITGLDLQDIKSSNAHIEDDPRTVDMLVGIEGVKISVTFKQDVDNGFNISFRSLGSVDVSKLAECFGGGGHKNASGCKIYKSKKNVINSIVENAGKFLK